MNTSLLPDVDLSLEMHGGTKHYVCSSGRVAICGRDLLGAHICPADGPACVSSP